MNKRIQELADKCYGPNLGGDWDFNEMKFAELIVKECSRWIKSQDEADHPTAWLLCDELEKHFGVKS